MHNDEKSLLFSQRASNLGFYRLSAYRGLPSNVLKRRAILHFGRLRLECREPRLVNNTPWATDRLDVR